MASCVSSCFPPSGNAARKPLHGFGVTSQILQTETQVEPDFRAVWPDLREPRIAVSRVLVAIQL